MADNMFSQAPMSTYYGFGINPAYTTPAYMSNFRPAYASDTDPYNPYSQNRSYADALRTQYLFQPAGTFASDPSEDERANNWALNSMNSDGFMNGVTKIGVPLGAWYAANKFFGQKVGANSPTAGLYNRSSAYARAIYQGQGMGAAANAWSSVAARQSLGGAMGSGFGRFAGSTFGRGIGLAGRAVGLGGALGGAAAVGGTAGAVLGGAVGALAAPILGGAALAKASNYYLSDPYVGIRRGEDAMLANTANTFVGGQATPNMGTFGISATHANSLSRAFMSSNIQDKGFKPGDYAAMADYGMQAGLFNEVGNMNVDQMKKKVEGMADAVKMIMAVANTNSVKEAIQYMGRLKAAGVSTTGGMNRVMSEMGIASGVSGASAEQIMNTVGNQGQMIAQRLGILPIMGQRQASSIFAGFANAYKSGSLHQADVAAMGGVEGATQLVMEGGGRIMNNPYFKAAINSGAELGTGNMLNVSQAFGGRRASNPLQSFSEDQLNFGVNASQYLGKHSMGSTVLNYLYDKSKYTPAAQMKDGSGKVNIMSAVGMAIARGELSAEEGRAVIEQYKMSKEPDYQRRMEQATRGSADKQMQQYTSQQGYDTLSGVPLIGRMYQVGRDLNRDGLAGGSAIGGAFTKMRAGMADSWDSFAAGIQGRTRDQDRPVARYGMENGVQTYQTTDYYAATDTGHRMTQYDGVMKAIAADSAADPTSELGKVVTQLKANFGKKGADNRALLDKYYRLKKGDVGAPGGYSKAEYMDFANQGLQYGVAKTTKQTAADLNPKVSDDFLTAYVDGLEGKGRAAVNSEYVKSDAYKTAGFMDKYTPFGDGFEKFAKGRFGKGDGARVFNAAIRSQARTGKADLGDLFDAGGDGKTSYYSADFGKLLSQYKQDKSKMSAEDRSRVEEYLAMQKMSGLGGDKLSAIDQGILALGRGDTDKAGILYGKDGDALRAGASNAINAATERMDVSSYRKGVKGALVGASYTGVDVDALDSRTDSSLGSLSAQSRAEMIKRSGEISAAARDNINQNVTESQSLSDKFGGEDALKSFGDVADGIGKATEGLSGSADALTKAASELSKAAKAGGNDPRLTAAIENLNRILPGLKGGPSPGVNNNFGGPR